MDFLDGMEHAFMMPSITAEERTAIWDVVAGYIQERLLQHQSVRIPRLGSFDIVPERMEVGDETVTIQRPRFYLAGNLVAAHYLMDNKDYLPGHKDLEPLRYYKVAAAASVSRRKAEICIQGTISLLSACLEKGKNIALVLRDIGVLVIERKKVQMRFFHDFPERIRGNENWEKALSKVPWLLDTLVFRDVPLGLLTDSGHVIAFPEFTQQFVPKPPRTPLKHWGRVPGDDNWRKRRILRVLGQDTKGALDKLPSPTAASLSHAKISELQETKGMLKNIQLRWLPAIPEDSTGKTAAGKKPVVSSQCKGQPTHGGQAAKQSQAQAAKPQCCTGGRQGEKKVPVGHKLLSTSSEASMHEESKVFISQPPGSMTAELLNRRPEAFWSVVKEPQKKVLAGYSFQPCTLVSIFGQHQSLQTTPIICPTKWP